MKIRFESDLLKQAGDSPNAWRAIASALPISALLGIGAWLGLDGVLRGAMAIAVGVAVFVLAEVVVPFLLLWWLDFPARALTSFVAPSGGTTPSQEDWSYEKSLLARGQVDDALRALEVRMINHPADPALFLFVAEVHARDARDPSAAEELFLRARQMERVSSAQDYSATNRLIDLYLGPLDNAARAIEELQRLRARHPNTAAAAGAAKLLTELNVNAKPHASS